MWDACHGVGLRGTYMAACEAAPLLIETASQNTTRPVGSATIPQEFRRFPLPTEVSLGLIELTLRAHYNIVIKPQRSRNQIPS